MTYNLHPLFVHFPIALLFIYSILKVLPLPRWFPAVSWRQIERALLVFGVLGAFAALATGDTAEHLFKPDKQIVDAHSTFAAIATWLYAALLVGEIAAVINGRIKKKIAIVELIEKVLCNKILSVILAIFALAAIGVTGLLGGVMVYGTSADPFAGFVLSLLGLRI